MPFLATQVDGKKFMWDKGVYSTEAEAKEKMELYAKDGFEVVCLNEEGKHLVYSRRVVAEIILE
jgi:hypothetical protein